MNLIQYFVNKIDHDLKEKGFRLKKDIDGANFKNKQKFGFNEISITSPVLNRNDGYAEIGVVLSIRHDVVENLVNQLGHIWGVNNQKNTTTVSRALELFPFKADRDRKQIIRNSNIDDDCDFAVQNILEMLESDGSDFFNRYSSLEECAEGLNFPIEVRSHPLCNLMPLRAYYGVATAALTGSGSVSNLVSKYLEYLRDEKLIDPLRYAVGRGESGLKGIEERLNLVAQLGIDAAGGRLKI